MSGNRYSVEDCSALLASAEGRAGNDAIHGVERAIGAACSRDVSAHWLVPQYLTTAEGAPGYGDRCWQMVAALRAWATDDLTVDEGTLNIAFNPHSQTREAWAVPDTMATTAPGRWLFDVEATTLADALCLALAAAGLLHREAKGDD